MEKFIISIDWDHTFRNLNGIDLNILSLVYYAKAKSIPVGVTTHRDIENTTLYALYYWQYEKPSHESDALAAAIHYWDKRFFSLINLKLDFINARYQPVYHDKNYYESVLLPHEIELAEQITKNKILNDCQIVKNKIGEYAKKKEVGLNNNEFKQAQIKWLVETYQKEIKNGILYHIDDDYSVCQALPNEFNQLDIRTIFYDKTPLFFNQSCLQLFKEIGLLHDWESFLKNDYKMTDGDGSKYLSLCLFATQLCNIDTDFDIIRIISTNLAEIEPHITEELFGFFRFIQNLIDKIKTTKQPVYYYLNHWV